MGWLTSTWSIGVAIGAFIAAAMGITFFGIRLALVVDRLADQTGIGEALAGAILLAGANSIAGMVVSLVGAIEGDASLAVSNSVGGIAAQTAFIVVADLFYRRINLEHAATSLTNIFNSLLMITLLALVIVGTTTPDSTVLGIHPVTLLLVAAYGYGLLLSRRVEDEPMWKPELTSDTREDEPEETSFQGSLSASWAQFASLALIMTAAGYVIGQAGLSIIQETALSGTLVGTFFTSVTTSIPELVTAVAAVRSGALTLAVGGIVGGNTFDMLFIAVGDVAYQEGSIYAAVGTSDIFVMGWTMLLVALVGAGLVRRERRGIGFEGYGVLVLYVTGLAVLASVG